MANTVEELYTQVLGRAPDAEGLAYWKNAFGGSVDPAEQASFMQAAQAELANRTVAEQLALAPNLINNTSTVNTVAPTVVKARGGPVQELPPIPSTSTNPTVELYKSVLGRTPSQAEIDSWNFGSTIDPQELDRFLGAARNEVTTTMPTTGATGNIAKQILAQGTTGKWSGEGFGSAEKNAYDMAAMLAGQGITDINQFGVRTTPEGTQEYYNKTSGQAINPYYDKASGNIWGGTFAGKGSTAYGVQFDPTGKPVFYSQYGGSSSDVGNFMPIIQLALAATGAGGLFGNALLGAGANQIAASALGNALLGGATTGLAGGNALKGALLGGAGGALSGYLQNMPIDASNMTSAQFNDALENQLVKSMQGAGLSNAQISQWLENASAADIASVTSALPVTNASDSLLIEAAKNPITSSALTNVLSQVPTVAVTGKAPEQVSPDVINAANTLLSGGTTTTPTVEVTAEGPKKSEIPVVSNTPVTTITTVPTTGTPAGTTASGANSTDTKLTASDIIKLLGVGTTIAGINTVTGGTGGGGGGTGGFGALPTQGVPLNSQDYFNAIQQNYDRLLPALPRDVATPLRNWYNSSYGA